MRTTPQTLVELEKKFWQSIVDEDTDVALGLLTEPALMVSGHGTLKFDHAGYRRMAEQGAKVLSSYEMSDVDVVFPNDDTAILTYRVKQAVGPRGQTATSTLDMADSSTWVRQQGDWRCVMHTETPMDADEVAA